MQQDKNKETPRRSENEDMIGQEYEGASESRVDKLERERAMGAMGLDLDNLSDPIYINDWETSDELEERRDLEVIKLRGDDSKLESDKVDQAGIPGLVLSRREKET